MLDHFLSESGDVTACAEGKNADDLWCNIVDLVFESRDLFIVHVLCRIFTDKVKAPTLHDQVFPLQFACLIHLVKAGFFIHADRAAPRGHKISWGFRLNVK